MMNRNEALAMIAAFRTAGFKWIVTPVMARWLKANGLWADDVHHIQERTPHEARTLRLSGQDRGQGEPDPG